MKAVLLNAFGTPPAPRDDLPAPEPASDGVLVRVQASSANPVDNAIAAGMLSGMLEHEFPIILGRDYAGVVERIGPDVTRFAVGNEVYGFRLPGNPVVHDGSWAELITLAHDDSIAPKPAAIDLAAAGAAPLAAITAMIAIDALELSDGDTLLVVGATGGVGSFAVQLAAGAGVTVIAPALLDDEDYLRGLGVEELVDRDADVAAAVRERHPEGVDALLDLVSFTTGAFEGALREGGRVASPTSAAGEGPGRTNVVAMPSLENLERLTELLDGGLLVPVQDEYPLERAGEALQALVTAHTRGKLAVRVAT